MATKLALVILNLLFVSLLFSPCLAKPGYPKPGFSGKAKNNHNNLGMIKAAKKILISLLEELKSQSDPKVIQKTEDQKGVPESSGIYTISFAIGTPPQNVTTVLDISSNLIWTQCVACHDCINQSTPLYDSKLSSSYSNFSSLSCNDTNFKDSSVCKIIKPDLCPDGCYYTSEYDTNQNSSGIMGTEIFTFGNSSVPDILFGCGLHNFGDYDNSSGVLGLGRGPLSFVSQLGFMRFSYCLSSDQAKDSPVNFGPPAKIEGSGQSTPLVKVDKYPDLYYIGLVDITVGKTPLNIPKSTFELQANGEGGVFLATSFPVTYLEKAGYELVKKAIISQMNQTTVDGSYLGLDLCFNNSLTNATWPSLTLQFEGGANLELKPVNYMVKDAESGIQCLTILPSSGVSALGSFVQMDTNFVYDIENSTISFEKCGPSSSVICAIPHLVTTMVLFLLCMIKFF